MEKPNAQMFGFQVNKLGLFLDSMFTVGQTLRKFTCGCLLGSVREEIMRLDYRLILVLALRP